MPPKFEFPRQRHEGTEPKRPEINPHGVTIYPSPSFKALSPELQERVRQDDLTLEEAYLKNNDGVYEGSY